MALRGEPQAHRLFLLRHAEAAADSERRGDALRRLSPAGRNQARQLAPQLAQASIDLVLCSTALRAKQTSQLLNLRAPIRYLSSLYNASARRLLFELTALDEQLKNVLIIGHAPGLPSLVYSLVDDRDDAAGLAQIRPVFPPATLVGLEFRSGWSDVDSARLLLTSVPGEATGRPGHKDAE